MSRAGSAAGAAPWPAPAKLNLFLHILGRRADGYHELQTVFQFVDLCDALSFEPRADGRIVRTAGPADVPPESDLVVRAAEALRSATGMTPGVSIAVDKRIPVGGGLGGGSSDAATALVALNALWRTGLDRDALARLGLALGADVPVFVRGQAAFGEGVGERLTPIEPPESHYVIVHPGQGVATADVFHAPELTRNSAPITIRAFLREGGRNDCEAVVRQRYPEVARALEWLGRFGAARLTGTGACVFVAVQSRARAEEICRTIPPGWRGFACRGRNRSPLEERLREFDQAGS
jgi:4-diphosphocytidyl-2-C-methyl-D-erythritol kinase